MWTLIAIYHVRVTFFWVWSYLQYKHFKVTSAENSAENWFHEKGPGEAPIKGDLALETFGMCWLKYDHKVPWATIK